MMGLQERGCHNINFVTPEHVVPQVIEAIAAAVPRGLVLPIVYNTSAYDALASLRLLDGIVDIYMPDFKFWQRESARRLAKAKDYPQRARAAILEMQRQVGSLRIGPDGLARRGLLVRHLVMPGRKRKLRRSCNGLPMKSPPTLMSTSCRNTGPPSRWARPTCAASTATSTADRATRRWKRHSAQPAAPVCASISAAPEPATGVGPPNAQTA